MWLSFQLAFGDQDSANIQIKNNLLTIRVKSVPLKQVLERIEDEAQIKIFIIGAVDKHISANFSNVPLEGGLKRIFRNFNSVFIYNSKKDVEGKPMVQSILIFPTVESNLSNTSGESVDKIEVKTTPSYSLTPEPGSDFRSDEQHFRSDERREFQRNVDDSSVLIEDEKTLSELSDELLGNDDSETRADAADMLGSLGDEHAVVFLIQALDDSNGEVRKSAVEAMALIGSREAIPYLRSVLNDSSDEVRSAAANALKEFSE